jgi:hypothetical protein
VNKLLDPLEPELKRINFNPNRLYNCDETGVSVVQHKNTKVIAMKCKKAVASLTSAERGCLITVVTCINAAGHYIPPLVVFPRKNMQIELMDGTPPGCSYTCRVSGRHLGLLPPAMYRDATWVYFRLPCIGTPPGSTYTCHVSGRHLGLLPPAMYRDATRVYLHLPCIGTPPGSTSACHVSGRHLGVLTPAVYRDATWVYFRLPCIGTPPGSTYACRVSGRIQTDIFTQWFRHFISVTKPTVDYPVLLILDGHYSHTRNIDVITL